MKKQLWYRLEGKSAVPCDPDTADPGTFEPGAMRHVADETIDGVRISTVFLWLDHGWGDGPPILFETMVFGGAIDQERERYSTWAEAEAGHLEMVKRTKAARVTP